MPGEIQLVGPTFQYPFFGEGWIRHLVGANQLLSSQLGEGLDTDVQDWFDRAEALGGSYNLSAWDPIYTEAVVKAGHDAFFKALKGKPAGVLGAYPGARLDIWDKITEMYALAGVTFDGLMAKLKVSSSPTPTPTLTLNNFDPVDLSPVGVGAGLTGDGATKSLVLTSTPTGGLLTHVTGAPTITSDFISQNAYPSSNRIRLFLESGNVKGNIGGNSGNVVSASTAQTGVFILSRQSATSLKLFKNGSQIGEYTTSVSFVAPDVGALYGFANLTSGTTSSFSDARQTILMDCAYDLTDAEAAYLSWCVNAWATYFGHNTYYSPGALSWLDPATKAYLTQVFAAGGDFI